RWTEPAGSRVLPLDLIPELFGERVQLRRRVPRVGPRDQERGDELEKAEDHRHVDVAEHLRGHEVTREARQQHVEQVPRPEGDGHREGPAPELLAQLLEPGTRLYLFVDRPLLMPGGHGASYGCDLDHG